MRVSGFSTNRGGIARNQYRVTTGEAEYYQSYSTMIARRMRTGGEVTLSPKYDCSRTTLRYLCQFLGLKSVKKIRQLIAEGVYTVAEL